MFAVGKVAVFEKVGAPDPADGVAPNKEPEAGVPILAALEPNEKVGVAVFPLPAAVDWPNVNPDMVELEVNSGVQLISML
jgi:hypothetical protein